MNPLASWWTLVPNTVLNQKLRPVSKKTSLVQGVMGTKRYCWTMERKVNLGTHQVSHSFLVIPECPAPLLERDLLTKVNAQIHFDLGECQSRMDLDSRYTSCFKR